MKQCFETEFFKQLGLDRKDFPFELHLAGFDGECFQYSVYFADPVTDAKLNEVKEAVDALVNACADRDVYMGYLDVKKAGVREILIYHDLGGVDAENENPAIREILKTISHVQGIRSVIINEDSDVYF